jgi:hypothetical protein
MIYLGKKCSLNNNTTNLMSKSLSYFDVLKLKKDVYRIIILTILSWQEISKNKSSTTWNIKRKVNREIKD